MAVNALYIYTMLRGIDGAGCQSLQNDCEEENTWQRIESALGDASCLGNVSR